MQLCSGFLWKGKEQSARGARVSWDCICHPKSEGGLGLKDLESWNQACILQSIWAIITKSGSLWIAWIQEYVLKGRRLWDQEANQNGGSWAWKKLLKLRSLAQKFIVMKDGRETWKFSGEKYSTVAVWKEIRPRKEKTTWHRLLWSPFVVPKHAVIAWMAILNRLPTKDRLRSWGVDIAGECPFCSQELESRNHIFFECPFSRAIWKMILSLSGLRRDVSSWNSKLNWAWQRLKGKALISTLLRIGWSAYIYHIWRERNNRLFRQKEETKEQILDQVKEAIRHRLAKLKNVAKDPTNMSLLSSWGLFESIFDSA